VTVEMEVRPMPDVAQALIDAWLAADSEARDSRQRSGTTSPFTASKAGSCARDLAYVAAGLEPSDPPGPAARWRMGIGTMVHDRLAEARRRAWPDAVYEPAFSIGDPPLVRGRGDVWLPETRTAIEIKTINGFGFKRMIGARGTADGPRTSHVRQLALEAAGLGAAHGILVYLSLENLSGREAASAGRDDEIAWFAEQYDFEADDLTAIADAELERLARIADYVKHGKTVPRRPPDLPGGAEITDPAKGMWVRRGPDGAVLDTGTWWGCGYCWNQTRCVEDLAAGR